MKTFIGISSFQILAMFRRGLFYTYLSIYLRHFLGLSVTMTSLFATLPMLLNVLAQRYLWGVLSDKYQQRRSLIIWGEILAGIGTALLWGLHRIPAEKFDSGLVVIAGLMVIETFWSMSNVGWYALISDIYPPLQRGKVMGRLTAIGGVGGILGVFAGGLFYDGMGRMFPGWGFYEGSLFFLSAGVMFVSVIPMLWVPKGGVKLELLDDSSTSPPIHFDRRAFAFFILAMTLINFGRNATSSTLSQYLELESGFGLSASTLGYFVNLRSIAVIATGLLVGRMLDRNSVHRLLMISACIASLSLFVVGSSNQLVGVAFSQLASGFAEVIILATSYQLAAEVIPLGKRATLFSVFNATFFLSSIASTLVTSPLTDLLIAMGRTQVFAYRVSFIVAGFMTLAGVAVLLRFYRVTPPLKIKQNASA